MDFKYKITVIVPVYNVEDYIESCLDSLVNQTIDKSWLEVLLIDDGSPDNSAQICKKYCEKYPFFKLLSKENEGLSRTRNYGIRHAQGKYMAFLDSDDTLSENALETIVNFFEKHDEEIDIVTYKIIPYFNGKKSGELHYRYGYLKHEGVYNLNLVENIFITQTNVNICVRNKGKDNIFFDTTENFRHEDQKYNIDVVRDKMKIGYCPDAIYYYTKNPSSITNTIFYSYYIFETTMKFWEDLFASFNGDVPEYFQAMYINDINWKTQADILLPYHYSKEKFAEAEARICALLGQVNDRVILKHPKVETLHTSYMIGLKHKGKIDVVSGCGGAVLLQGNKPIYVEQSMVIYICRFKVDEEKVYIDAFVRTPITSFTDNVKVYAYVSGDYDARKIELQQEKSAWDYYHAKIRTNKFIRVRFDWDYKKYAAIQFVIEVDSERIPVKFDFASHAPFSTGIFRSTLFRCGYKFIQGVDSFNAFKSSTQEAESFNKHYMKVLLLRKPRTFFWRYTCGNIVNKNRRIWLYCDCRNVYKDNAYYQFIHDFDKNDGVERYYVVNDDMNRNELFTPKQKKNVIRFGSRKHKQLFLASEKVITAFAEHNNFNPFKPFVWKFYTDLFKAEVVYLQHGVLHAFLPWKYSNDRLLAVDREVISTSFEVENFTQNYGFRECDLIPAGMPRYDFIDIEAAKSENKILFAPTWRKYLIGMDKDGNFFPTPEKFKKSDFFKETYEFLHSKKVEEALEKNDWYLDFKLHPIFSKYSDLYELEGKRIRIADKSVDEKSYKVFITDFSSFCFDFVYLKKTLMYFVPDDEMFRAGMNDYRKLDLPLEEGFGPLAHSAVEAENAILDIIARNGEAEPVYMQRMDKMFLHSDKNCRARIYEAIK